MQTWLREMRDRNLQALRQGVPARLTADEYEKARQQKHAEPKPIEPWLEELLGRVTQYDGAPQRESEGSQ